MLLLKISHVTLKESRDSSAQNSGSTFLRITVSLYRGSARSGPVGCSFCYSPFLCFGREASCSHTPAQPSAPFRALALAASCIQNVLPPHMWPEWPTPQPNTPTLFTVPAVHSTHTSHSLSLIFKFYHQSAHHRLAYGYIVWFTYCSCLPPPTWHRKCSINIWIIEFFTLLPCKSVLFIKKLLSLKIVLSCPSLSWFAVEHFFLNIWITKLGLLHVNLFPFKFNVL